MGYRCSKCILKTAEYLNNNITKNRGFHLFIPHKLFRWQPYLGVCHPAAPHPHNQGFNFLGHSMENRDRRMSINQRQISDLPLLLVLDTEPTQNMLLERSLYIWIFTLVYLLLRLEFSGKNMSIIWLLTPRPLVVSSRQQQFFFTVWDNWTPIIHLEGCPLQATS